MVGNLKVQCDWGSEDGDKGKEESGDLRKRKAIGGLKETAIDGGGSVGSGGGSGVRLFGFTTKNIRVI